MTQLQPADPIPLLDAAHRVLMWEACIFAARLSANTTHRSPPETEPNPKAQHGSNSSLGHWEFCHPVLTNSLFLAPPNVETAEL